MPDKFVPESVRAKLVVGQRVRYVPDGDCELLQPTPDSYAAPYGATGHEGFTNAEGKTGIITSADHRLFPEHPYDVEMDEEFQFGGRDFQRITVAAHELALVED